MRKGQNHTKEAKEKMSVIKKQQFSNGLIPHNKGHKNPTWSKRQKENNVSKRPEVRKKMSLARKRYYAKGNHPWNYIDGSSKNRKYTWKKWINFAKEIYERDNFTCQECGKKGGLLNAHHILPWAGNPSLVFNPENIITLCVPCHSRIHMTLNNPRKRTVKSKVQGVIQ